MRKFEGSISAVLSVSLVVSATPGFGQAATLARTDRTADRAPARPAYRGQIQGEERILHALNRFTFGPRADDGDAVKAMGLDAWFDQQLQPQKIDNAALQIKLAAFPAMQWSAEDLLYRLPSNAVIRQVMDGKAPMPQNAVLRAVYEDQIARVTARREKQGTEKQGSGIRDQGSEKQAQGIRDKGIGTEMADGMVSPGVSKETAEDAMAEVATDGKKNDAELLASLTALEPVVRVRHLVAMQPTALDAFLRGLKGPQRAELTADMTPEQKLIVQALESPDRAVAEELMAQRLMRDIYSNSQLQEVMTDFWLNHFNVYLRKNEATPYYLVSYERDVIRPRALGKFEDLLEAVAHSPAMLIYLDNAQSTGPNSVAAQRAKLAAARGFEKNRKAPEGLNENYARELMELHTLGVNGGYTQADVIQAARILTGWTVERPQRGGGFEFDENQHEPGTKKVMGQKFKDKGELEGEELLHFLATRPATARFISRKLAMRFVSDDPPQTLVERMAQAYLKSGGDISMVLRTMYRSPEFWTADTYRAKVKTPLEYVVSAARASDAEITNMQPLIAALRTMGMPLYGCIPPTGYKWEATEWVSTAALVNRMNFALALAANRLPGIKTTGATGGATAALESEETRLETRLVPGGVSSTTRSAVLGQVEQQKAQAEDGAMPVPMGTARRELPAAPVERQDQVLAGLLLGSPEFQRR